jgi:hypothetical protein
METTQLPVLLGHCHTFQILVIPYSLEIAAYDKKIHLRVVNGYMHCERAVYSHLVVVLGFKRCNLTVDGVEFAMAASFDCYLANDS